MMVDNMEVVIKEDKQIMARNLELMGLPPKVATVQAENNIDAKVTSWVIAVNAFDSKYNEASLTTIESKGVKFCCALEEAKNEREEAFKLLSIQSGIPVDAIKNRIFRLFESLGENKDSTNGFETNHSKIVRIAKKIAIDSKISTMDALTEIMFSTKARYKYLSSDMRYCVRKFAETSLYKLTPKMD